MTTQIPVIEKINKANDQLALLNQHRLDEGRVLGLNLLASPGAGKTSLIEQTLPRIATQLRTAVIDGDIATSLDAERAAAAGAVALQINTGGACHLDAMTVGKAFDELDLATLDLLVIENVGNLICPASFRLGTHANVLVASLPEGADKPFKYPTMYRGVDLVLLNKVDLAPYVSFERERFEEGVRALNQDVEIFPISCVTGEGLDAWISWIEERRDALLRSL